MKTLGFQKVLAQVQLEKATVIKKESVDLSLSQMLLC